MNIRKILNAYEENDIIYIEDQYLVLTEDDDDNNTVMLLKFSNDTDSIISNIDQNILKQEPEEIMSKYSSKMQKYKHTFKKNADGNYYWYSTSPVLD